MAKSCKPHAVCLPSDRLHQVLLHNRSYRAWHQLPGHQVVHWAVLLAFVLGGVLGFIFSLALQPGEGRAAGLEAEAVRVEVREVAVEKIVWDKGAENQLTRAEFARAVADVFGPHNLVVARPHEAISRAEAAQVVLNLVGVAVGDCQPTDFNDIEPCSEYGPYATFAVQNDLLAGSTDGFARPHDRLTPAEATKLLGGVARLVGVEL